MKNLTMLIRKIVDRAIFEPIFSPGIERQKIPGYHILHLTKEERELLKEAKPKDFNHRFPR